MQDNITIKSFLNIPIVFLILYGHYQILVKTDSLPQRIHHCHLTKTILNIKNNMQDSTYQLHEDDETSVMLKVHSMKPEKYTPILIYKPKRELNQ